MLETLYVNVRSKVVKAGTHTNVNIAIGANSVTTGEYICCEAALSVLPRSIESSTATFKFPALL